MNARLKSTLLMGFVQLFVTLQVSGQNTDLKIADNVYMVISENSTVKINGDLIIGNGQSGTIDMKGNVLDLTGNLDCKEGSDLKIKSGVLSFLTGIFADLSTTTYYGNNFEIKNLDYGQLVLSGSGDMTITGPINTPTSCYSLTINNTGNSMVIPELRALTVENSLVNHAGVDGLIVESGSSGDGSLISYSINTPATVGRYLKGNRWHYISSPICAAPLTLFNTNNFIWWDASMEWTGLGDWSPWLPYTNPTLNNAQGYGYYDYETTIDFKGNLNVENYNLTLLTSGEGISDYQGWNLIGNPFTSVLDWDLVVADNSIPVGVENAIYFFDDEAQNGEPGNYRYYVPSTGGTYGIGTDDANGLIPSGQGFFIKCNTNNSVLTLKSDYRSHATQEFYKQTEKECIKLSISGMFEDEMIIRKVEDASDLFDGNYDARKMLVSDPLIPQIFAIDKNNILISIQSIPAFEDDTRIKIGISCEPGQYEINLRECTTEHEGLYLKDYQTDIEFDLSKGSAYSFLHSGGGENNRFELFFKSTVTSIPSLMDENIQVYPNPVVDILSIENFGASPIESVNIKTITGSVLLSEAKKSGDMKFDVSSLSQGLYIVEINLSDGSNVNKKMIIKK